MGSLLMRNWLLSYLILACLSFSSQAQEEVQVKRERVFTGSGLYGFMNGGAEQFLEYGVSRLTARDIVYKGEEYAVEIYEMPSAEDAFGIYSLHIFKCQRADTLGCIDCLSPYQLQAVVGDKYVSVVFPSGTQAGQRGADEVLRKYLPMSGENNPRVPEILGLSSPYSGSVKYLRGPIGISGVSTSLSKLLAECPIKAVWFLQEKGSDSYCALIYPKNSSDVKRLLDRLPSSSLLVQGEDFLYIKGMEEETGDDQGDFGF